MKSFKRAIYKTGNIEEEAQISCDSFLRANGASGIYEVEIFLGTDKGYSGVTYEAFEIPDRFQLFSNDVLVADSKFVGDDLNYYKPFIIGTHELPIFRYSEGVFVDSGETETVTYTNADFADGTPSQPQDGNGRVRFYKEANKGNTVKLRVIGVVGSTIWNITPICPDKQEPTQLPVQGNTQVRKYNFMLHKHGMGSCSDINEGVLTPLYAIHTLAKGVKLYKNDELFGTATDGEYWLGNMIYLIDTKGTILDIYPCSGVILD